MWRDWFTFSRQDRRAIFLLALLILIALGLLYTKPMWKHEEPYEAQASDSLIQKLTGKPKEEPLVKIALHPLTSIRQTPLSCSQ